MTGNLSPFRYWPAERCWQIVLRNTGGGFVVIDCALGTPRFFLRALMLDAPASDERPSLRGVRVLYGLPPSCALRPTSSGPGPKRGAYHCYRE